MKKNLIALMTVTTMLVSGAAVFADEAAQPDTPFETIIQGDIMLISGDTPISAPVSMPSYIANTVTVTEIGENTISTTVNNEDAENPENTINYTINENTIVLGYANGDVKSVKDIKKGDKITVYSNGYSPAPLIMPPQYSADVIFVEDNLALDSLRMADVDTYLADGEMLVNAANTLALNIDETTEIVDREGKKVEADKLANNDLAVIYSISTRSIPAQTTPHKIVVLGENEIALKQIEAAKNEENAAPAPTEMPIAPPEEDNTDISAINDSKNISSIIVGDKKITNIYYKEDSIMVPLREVAETFGFTVEWDGELKEVMLNSGKYSLKIGEGFYKKGRMTPIELEVAPEIKDDLTYVPLSYFSIVLEANVKIEEVEDGTVKSVSLTYSPTAE